MAAKVVAPAISSCGSEVARSESRKLRSRKPRGGAASSLAVAALSFIMVSLGPKSFPAGVPGLRTRQVLQTQRVLQAQQSACRSPDDLVRLAGLHIDEAVRRLFAGRDQHPGPGRTGEGCEHQPLGKSRIPARPEGRL